MKLTDKELSKFSREHLCYEINQLFANVYWFGQLPQVDQNGFEAARRNTHAESVILHARCLYEFLYYPAIRHSDDARAFQYHREIEDWEKYRPQASAELQTFCRRAGKEIVHLTYARQLLTVQTKTWRLNSIAFEILKTLRLFAESADSLKIHEDVLKTIEHWERLIIYQPTNSEFDTVGAVATNGLIQTIGSRNI